MTLARRHFQRTTAAETAQAAGGNSHALAGASAYELMLAKLGTDKRRLKEIQSIERKIEVKRVLLPEYQPWVDGVLAEGRGAQDDVLMTVMLWRFDAQDFLGGLDIARYALNHKLVMPDAYERSTATVIAEEIAINALALIDDGEAVDVHLLFEAEGITRDQDMPDEVRAKLHKAIGYALRDNNKPEALNHLRRALQLHDRVGVKKDIEKIERELKNAAASTGS